MKPEIYIRTDGGPKIGLGHLVRCIALANMLREQFSITFFCKSIPQGISKEIEIQGFGLVQVENESEFLNTLNSSLIVILDGYQFESLFQKAIKDTGASLVCIDDLHDRKFYADLIINHAPGVRSVDYLAQPYTQFALGLDYVMLRPAFLKQAKLKRQSNKLETILVCFGGADPKNITKIALEEIISFNEFKKIIVITGPSYSFVETIQPIFKIDSRISYFHDIDEKELLKLMTEADVSLVPSSGILYEVISAGSMAVTGMYVNNQNDIYQEMVKLKGIFDAKTFKREEIKSALVELLAIKEKCNFENQCLFGDSDTRLIKIFNQILDRKNLVLRRAEPADLDITFKWASDSNVRAFSFSKQIISYEEHKQWFDKKLIDKSCVFLMAYYGNEIIGNVRFDIEEGKAIISYLLDPVYHGRGLGTAVLSSGLEYLSRENAIIEFSGLVMKQNLPSIKAFERLGFVANDMGDFINFKKAC